MSKWILDGNCWRDENSGDAGDYIFNAMSRDIDMEDKSERGHRAYEECRNLLVEERKRWPDRLNQEDTAPNFIAWWFNDDKYTRPQRFLTRDPYITVICRAEQLGRAEEIENIKIPWYCYSPKTWKWRRKLIKDNRANWKRRLTHYKARATAIATSDDPNIIANRKEAGLTFDSQ